LLTYIFIKKEKTINKILTNETVDPTIIDMGIIENKKKKYFSIIFLFIILII